MPKEHFTFVETSIFTKLVKSNLSDEEYRALQLELARDPNAGNVIPGSGGLRKLRWAGEGGGKSGGFRIIYYYAANKEMVLMLYMYAKSAVASLTKDQIKALGKIVKEEYK